MSESYEGDHQAHQPDAEPSGDDAVTALLEEPDEVEVEVEETRTTRRRSNAAQFSWANVAAVARFALRYADGSDAQRTAAREAFQIYDPSTTAEEAVDLAQALWPAGGSISAWDFFSSLVTKVETKTLSFTDGLDFASRLGEAPPEVLRGFARLVTDFTGTEIVYRKSVPISEIVNTAFMAVSSSDTSQLMPSITFVDGLLEEWPGAR